MRVLNYHESRIAHSVTAFIFECSAFALIRQSFNAGFIVQFMYQCKK